MASSVPTIGRAFLASTLLLVLCAVAVLLSQKPRMLISSRMVDVGVEHVAASSLVWRMSQGRATRIVEISNGGSETMAISVPEDWQRMEVRDVPLASVLADPSTFGFVRWQLPPGGTIVLHTPDNWASATLHNPSGSPLEVRLTTVDLAHSTSRHSVFLMQDKALLLAHP